jgi:anaerobic magnesium-protoporphyrin IX monomethyl ester cyclase
VRVLFIDLNSFSRYPTMSVGHITAALRKGDHVVTVLSPLSVGVEGYPRVTRPNRLGFLIEWAKYRTQTTRFSTVRNLRQRIVNRVRPTNNLSRIRTLEATQSALSEGYDIILISAYTMFRETCVDICAVAAERDIPVVLGGPLFNQKPVADYWLDIDGLTGVFGGEPEDQICKLAAAVVKRSSPVEVPGYSTRKKFRPPAAPLQHLDKIPFPDYSDFPWEKYPHRIIPIMTGRGCGWGICTFCSDVITSSGRDFRSRSLPNVLEEVRWQSKRHDAKLFTFLDLKLNSNLDLWRGLAEEIQHSVPGAEWTASIHATARQENGLGAKDLLRARKAGLLRITTGLESGSPKMLNAMAKGTSLEVLSQTVRHAAEAGISVRLTVIVGYPEETGEDVILTKNFLVSHIDHVDRVVINRFALQIGTLAEEFVLNSKRRVSSLKYPKLNLNTGVYDTDNHTFYSPSHRRAMIKLLKTAHKINRKPLTDISTKFEGVM